MAKLSFLQFLCFRRSRSRKSPRLDSSNADGVSLSSRPSQVRTSQQAQSGPVAAAQSISRDSGRFTHDLQSVTPLVEANSAQTPGPPSSVAPPPINAVPPSQTTDSDPSQHQDLLLVPHWPPATASQASLLSQQSTPPPRQQLQDGNTDPPYVQNFHESRNVSVQGDGNHVNYTSTVVNNSNQFMEKLREKTIPGAAFDSSARDPPPRCHPGTRLAVLARCLEFIANAIGTKKMRWVVGKAGVGKSAIMQSVADSSFSSEAPGASVFFSINDRHDGAKAIITLAYQLAESCEPYRALIEYEIARKPSLLQSSLSVQFKKFVIEPFTHLSLLNSVGRVLIIIDGLDECDKSHTQRELLQLISDYCSTYPSSPIVWIIASRPEPHITSFFAQDTVKAVYEKEEILVDSDEARSDVEKFLRDELIKIQHEFSLNPQSQWPLEQDLWKLADASGGLFVFADTVVRYIGDPAFGNPTSQLNDVLKDIDTLPLPNVPKNEHPMARLDELYARILSKIPERIMVNTRKILLALVLNSRAGHAEKENFLVLCNWLGMTCDDVYAAIRHLLSVLDAPPRDNARKAGLRCFHKSFIDYISDYTRSGLFSDIEHEAYLLEVQCTFRILEQAPDGIDFGRTDNAIRDSGGLKMGEVARGPGTGRNISITWPIDAENDWNDYDTRLAIYKLANLNVVKGIKKGEPAFCTEFCIRLVTTRWCLYDWGRFPFRELRNLVFETSQFHEFMRNGILAQVSLKALCSYFFGGREIRMQFRRPVATKTYLSDPWNPDCKHERVGEWGKGVNEDWTTEFGTGNYSSACYSCLQRFKEQLEDWQTRSPDHPVTILFTSAGDCFVEFQFIDPDDGVSETTFWFVNHFSEEERRQLGSSV